MFGGQTWKDRSDLYCQISVFTLSLNVALKLKLRIKYLSAAKWQCATGLSPQDTSWAHTFGIIKRSMGKNKLLLYLITKKKKKKCTLLYFPCSASPLSFSLPYVVWWCLTPMSYAHYSSDIFFVFAAHWPFLFFCCLLVLPFILFIYLFCIS